MDNKKQMNWQWNNQSIPIRKLTDYQLTTIQETLQKTQRSKWFGHSTDEWKKVIDRQISFKARKELIKQMEVRRITKACNIANRLIPIFQKITHNTNKL